MCELCSSCGRNRKWVETHCVWCGGDLVCSECDATFSELIRERDELNAEVERLNEEVNCLKSENTELNSALDVYLDETIPTLMNTIAKLQKTVV